MEKATCDIRPMILFYKMPLVILTNMTLILWMEDVTDANQNRAHTQVL